MMKTSQIPHASEKENKGIMESKGVQYLYHTYIKASHTATVEINKLLQP